jgi:hypothetical protein
MSKESFVLDDDLEAQLGEGERGRRARIRCPQCAWQPGRHDVWVCHCNTRWNTFETRGVCPGCSYAWRVTQCLKCEAFSPHEDWYTES